MKKFTDFMIDAAQNPALGQECIGILHAGDFTSLSSWFTGKGYEVSEFDCKKLYDNKDPIKKGTSVGLTY